MYKVMPPAGGKVKGTIVLNGSKSIANRSLIIRALSQVDFSIDNLSNADDTAVLDRLLRSGESTLDAGAGGTTYRFLTAYLAVQEGREVVLTGSARMQERPIRVLVDALRQLGADIAYVKNEGYPPLRIKGSKIKGGRIAIPADTSSQYISALLMIGPGLEQGLQLELTGEIVSLPYILMTLNLMRYFGVEVQMEGQLITVKPGRYQARPFFVEADWSAASYYYAIAMLAKEADITLKGLSADSVQGDAVVAKIFEPWVETIYGNQELRILKKANESSLSSFAYDFLECPDLAQTVLAALGLSGIPATLNGLKTLLIKETDRVAALDNELSKYGVRLLTTDKDEWQLKTDGLNGHPSPVPGIDTYEDHRMAMAFAPLALKTGEMHIHEPGVVSKSYPAFWEDLRSLGFTVE